MKYLINSILIILLICCLSTFSLAQNTTRISDESIIKLSNVIEEYSQQKDLLGLYKQGNVELVETNKKQEEIINNDTKIMDIQKQEKEILENHIKFLINTIEVQNQIAEKALKNTKPSFWDKLSDMSLGAMVGSTIMGILLR